MKKLVFYALFFLPLCSNAQDIKQFNFLLGHWKNAKNNVSEHWVEAGKVLRGKSYKHNGNDSTLTEKVALKKIDGVWNYCVKGFEKDNQGNTNFALVNTIDDIFIFENKSHDFPQRVVYQNTGKKELKAWIEGQVNGNSKRILFSYLPY